VTNVHSDVLSAAECVELLVSVPVGRIGITVGALPVILPVNYSFIDGAIVFRTASGTKLASATANSVVAFEVDSFASDGHAGWSVLIQGTAHHLTGREELKAALAVLTVPWGVDPVADHVVRVEPRMLTGSRFRVKKSQPT
jgi:hypothetical protein